MFRTQLTLLACIAFSSQAFAQESPDSAPKWIWQGDPETQREVVFRRTFELSEVPGSATLAGSCDNHMTVVLNGERLGMHGRWEQIVARDVASVLTKGENLLEIHARNDGGPAGLAMRLSMDGGATIVTDAAWKAAIPQRVVRNVWSKVDVLGVVGDDALPWSGTVTAASYDAPSGLLTGADAGAPQPVRPAPAIHLLDGFEAELLYTVPNETQGSWVALTTDPEGRIYVSDQGGKGLYRVTPAPIGENGAMTTVEPVGVDVSGAQGLCWAFGGLYANVNGQGLWRITDTDGDDQLDRAVNLIPLGYGGEHGPHAILQTEDQAGLYFIAGNHTLPPDFEGSRAPSNWDEDLLLPRQWDARGHARGKLAPGGWIARCDPNGGDIQIISTGYRNQYDIAMNSENEMFTYDADMEWDIGSPWYRPTRVCHVTSGSEFGWRSGTGKWPTYYEDSLPPVLEIGPGSPTGIVFGTGAKFPERYQRALFVLDWTFGTIYALHLTPEGSTYSATKEDFAWAKPLGVTDAIIGDDGALYFAVGGRGSQSALYRIHYSGAESTERAESSEPDAGAQARLQRRIIESAHGDEDEAHLAAAWPLLGSDDRFLRFAARIAVENQPVAAWRALALQELRPRASATALLALARQGSPSDVPEIARVLGGFQFSALEEHVQLTMLRAYAVAFARHGAPSEALGQEIIKQLDAQFPAPSDDVNAELARVLTYLGSDTVVPKTMALMRAEGPTELPEWAELIQRNDTYGGPIAKMLADMPPVQNIAYSLILRNATKGWTMPLRKEYFEFFVSASKHPGGMSYAGFLGNIREEAAETLTVAEAHALAPLLGQTLVAPLPKNVAPPKGPGQAWTLADARAAVGDSLTGRSYESGKNLFHAASCSACHRFDGEGGAIGPDLTTVANKFSIADILEAMVEPSKVISDQYGAHLVLDTDGNIAEGILVEDGDEVTLYPRDPAEAPTVYDRSEIERIQESKTSQMPAGLIDPMNAGELKDLVAFLVSGGDRKAQVFRKPAQRKNGQQKKDGQ